MPYMAWQKWSLLQQRGQMKEQLMKKIQQEMIEKEKHRIPIAQGLPWTTDEPQVSSESK